MLELGAGTALVGVTAAAHGACAVVTDLDTRLAALNVAQASETGLEGRCTVETLDWREPEAFLASRTSPFDWILAADVVYHQQADFTHLQALARLLARLLPNSAGTKVLFGYQERDVLARHAFWAALEEGGLKVSVQALAELAAEGRVGCEGLFGPMELWWISRATADEEAREALTQAPAEHA